MIIRNIKCLIRQYPLSLILSFIGLTLSFTVFLVISHQVDYELSFDTCHPTSNRVYRADKKGDESIFRNILPRGFSDDIIASSPHIKAGCSLCPYFGDSHFSTIGTDPIVFKMSMNFVTPGFIDVFGVEMLEGNSQSLELPNSVIIPKSLADVLFSGQSAVGKTLRSNAVQNESNGLLTIAGVYKDFPSNTQLGNIVYASAGRLNEGTYQAANFICYLLLDDECNRQVVEDNFNKSFDFSRFENWLKPIELTKFTDIYFLNEGNVYKSGSYSQLILLIAIAMLVLFTGMINFTNFYIALTPMRMKNVNTRLVFGASKSSLRCEIVGESFVWSCLAFVFALMLFNPICATLCEKGLIPESFELGASISLLWGVVAVVVIGVLSGILPGIYSTSMQPILALKGSFALSKSGRTMRTMLVYVQIIVSFVMLVYVLSIEKQNNYMKEYPCGYDSEKLIIANIGAKNIEKHRVWLRDKLLAVPCVQDIAFAAHILGGSDSYTTSGFDFGFGSGWMSVIYCTHNFPSVLGLEVVEGEPFSQNSSFWSLVTINMKQMGVHLGKCSDQCYVKGFVNNVNITSLRKADHFVNFCMINDENYALLSCLYIRIADNADRVAVSNNLRSILKEMDSLNEYDILMGDNLSGMLYSGEERLRKEIWLFSLLAILLSLVGVWGQTIMDVRYRRKEIAIKRVLGAPQKTIVAEGLLHYAKIVGVCFVIATPFAYFASENYLSRFARQAGISPMMFVVSFVTILALVMIVVVYHYLVCLRTNPADVLKNE